MNKSLEKCNDIWGVTIKDTFYGAIYINEDVLSCSTFFKFLFFCIIQTTYKKRLHKKKSKN